MPRLMVTDCYRDRLIRYQDFEENITTADVEKFTREVLHHRGRIKEKGHHEWWVCGADGIFCLRRGGLPMCENQR